MNLQEKAETLNISTHTLRNWNKRRESAEKASTTLVSRANKLNSSRHILPVELLQFKENKESLQNILDVLLLQPLNLEGKILLFSLHFLVLKGLLQLRSNSTTQWNLLGLIRESSCAPVMQRELKMRLSRLPQDEKHRSLNMPRDFFSYQNQNLQRETDLPGLIYQTLRNEGTKSRKGAWFTPASIIDSMIAPYVKQTNGLYDPCCGSGLFLCRFAEKKGNPDCVRGMDSDPTSVFLSRINLFSRFPQWENFNNIREGNSLKVSTWQLNSDDLVATNPPWGAHLSAEEKKEMLQTYPEISSSESASLFLLRSTHEMHPGGVATFLLPESLFYVKTHKDIRTWILHKAPPLKIMARGALFKGVLTAVVSCDFRKEGKQRKATVFTTRKEKIKGSETLYKKETQPLNRFVQNPDKIINFHCSLEAQELIKKIRNSEVKQLPKGCLWLLGVVTGDNKRFICESREEGTRPLLTGKDLYPFGHHPVCHYLKIDDGPLQQNRPLEEYARPKLAYRFIGYKPVFSIDRKGFITLNSANGFVPPRVEDLEEFAFWYNSSLFRFLWFNQYRSVKMLRRHLEELPLPLWDKHELKEVSNLAKRAEKRQDVQSLMDEMIFRHFKLTKEEISIVFNQS
ncbi:N-6 DNA methylase [Oceanispirochaeta crateris]|nr:N-6 DNA methylase [Oceanispirochaeta crateris]